MKQTAKRKQEPHQYFSISVVAKMVGVHAQTLRLYERLGLVTPKRTEHGKRIYSLKDVERIKRVQDLTRGMGVNLAGVEVALRLSERVQKLEEELERLRKRFWQEAQRQAEILASRLVAQQWEEYIRQRTFPVQLVRGGPIVPLEGTRRRDWSAENLSHD
ncbi:MAG: MerR family transcriptional regulator [Armatimonadetes bacterium]|nr:MerR family transcriptional regulator [Armatimonadota bacterium]MDW8121280.1 MerR family transcriptional regulator [Armatimonadota bacterium]